MKADKGASAAPLQEETSPRFETPSGVEIPVVAEQATTKSDPLGQPGESPREPSNKDWAGRRKPSSWW